MDQRPGLFARFVHEKVVAWRLFFVAVVTSFAWFTADWVDHGAPDPQQLAVISLVMLTVLICWHGIEMLLATWWKRRELERELGKFHDRSARVDDSLERLQGDRVERGRRATVGNAAGTAS